MPDPIDILYLLEPFAGDVPSGTDPRSDVSPQSAYFRLRDARSEARQAERAADHDAGDSGASPAWGMVQTLASTILSEVGKDIEVASWLAEAMVRRQGLAGLTAAATMIAGLVERYWSDGLYPLPDEDGLEGRVAALAGLNGTGSDGTLMQPLRKLVLFERGEQSVTLWRFERAEDVEGIGEAAKKKKQLGAGVLPFKEVEDTARTTGAASLIAIGREAILALAAWRYLVAVLDVAAGQQAPPSSRVAAIIDKIVRIAERYVADRMATVEALPEPEVEDATIVTESAAAAPPRPPTPTRESMLKTLTEVAQFFRQHEPHSPLAYTLDEAVRRGRLTWPELLGEVVPDPQARAIILSQLGIRPVSE